MVLVVGIMKKTSLFLAVLAPCVTFVAGYHLALRDIVRYKDGHTTIAFSKDLPAYGLDLVFMPEILKMLRENNLTGLDRFLNQLWTYNSKSAELRMPYLDDASKEALNQLMQKTRKQLDLGITPKVAGGLPTIHGPAADTEPPTPKP